MYSGLVVVYTAYCGLRIVRLTYMHYITTIVMNIISKLTRLKDFNVNLGVAESVSSTTGVDAIDPSVISLLHQYLHSYQHHHHRHHWSGGGGK